MSTANIASAPPPAANPTVKRLLSKRNAMVLGVLALASAAVLGDGLPHHITSAEQVDLLSDLATHGNVGAQLQLGLAYRDGEFGLAPDKKSAMHWLETAAGNGNTYAANVVGDAYAAGDGVAASVETARKWWSEAGNGGIVAAQRKLGASLIESGDVAQARIWLDRAAAQGDAEAHRLLGTLFAEHEATTSDMELGSSGIDRFAAQSGSPTLKALAEGADLLEAASPESAPDTADLRKQAKQGDPVAEYELGIRYMDGYDNGKPDPARAEKWLRKSAESGDGLASEALTNMQHGAATTTESGTTK